MAVTSSELLASLPATFRFKEGVDRLGERRLRRLLGEGRIVAVSRGLYRKSDWLGDDDSVEIATRAPRATLCLSSALARHDLIDDIPARIDVAIPRGSWTPRTNAPVRWRHFDPDTFDIGRDTVDVGAGRRIGQYDPPRSIIDAFRMRHIDGSDLANEALKRWLRQGGQPADLLAMAAAFPRTRSMLRETLEVLL